MVLPVPVQRGEPRLDLRERGSVGSIHAFAAHDLDGYETGLAEESEVTADGGTTDRSERLGHPSGRQREDDEQLDDPAADRVGNGGEDVHTHKV